MPIRFDCFEKIILCSHCVPNGVMSSWTGRYGFHSSALPHTLLHLLCPRLPPTPKYIHLYILSQLQFLIFNVHTHTSSHLFDVSPFSPAISNLPATPLIVLLRGCTHDRHRNTAFSACMMTTRLCPTPMQPATVAAPWTLPPLPSEPSQTPPATYPYWPTTSPAAAAAPKPSNPTLRCVSAAWCRQAWRPGTRRSYSTWFLRSGTAGAAPVAAATIALGYGACLCRTG